MYPWEVYNLVRRQAYNQLLKKLQNIANALIIYYAEERKDNFFYSGVREMFTKEAICELDV